MASALLSMARFFPIRACLFVFLTLVPVRTLAVVLSPNAIAIAPATLPNAQLQGDYSQQLTASGGTSPYSYAVTSGALPAELTLSASGLLSGKPTQAGAFTFDVTATDSLSATATQSYTLAVCRPISFLPGAVPDAVVNQPYSVTLGAVNAEAPLTFSVTGGALPAGITLTAAGLLSGSPTATGSFAFSAKVTDNLGCTAWNDFTLDVTTGTAASNLVATPQSSSAIGLAWTDPQKGETGFRVERSIDGTFWSPIQIVGGNTTAYTDTGRLAATMYFYRVIATSAGGDQPPSNVAAATTHSSSALQICKTDLSGTQEGADWPTAASNGTNWALAWMDLRGGDVSQIYFQFANKTTGAPIGAAQQISSSDMPAAFPSLRWNGSHFGLMWLEHTRLPDGRPPSRFAFALLDSDGTLLRRDVRTISTNASPMMNTAREFPLVWDGSGWGVFLIEDPAPSEISFYRIDEDGDLLAGPVNVTNNGDFDSDISAAWSGAEYGMAWVRSRDGNASVYFQRLSSSGSPLGTPVQIEQTTLGQSFVQTDVVWDGSGWAVAWRTNQPGGSRTISLRLLQADGTPKSASARISDDGTPQDSFPRILPRTGGGYTIYVGFIAASGAAEVGRLTADANGARVGTRTIVSTDDGLDSGVPPSVFSEGGSDLLFWTGSTATTYEVELAIVNSSTGAVTAGPTLVTVHTAPGGSRLPFVMPLRGGFLSMWADNGVYARIVDASGTATTRYPLAPEGINRRPVAVPTPDGFAAAWTSSGVRLGLYDATGTATAGPVTISTRVNNNRGVALAFSGEEFGLLWSFGSMLMFQRVDRSGATVGPVILAASAASSIGADSMLQWIGMGWAAVWNVSGNLWYTLLDAGGATLVAPAQLTFGNRVAESQLLWTGSYLGLVFSDHRGFNPPGYDMYFTVLGSDGIKAFPEVTVVSTPYGDRPPAMYWAGDRFRVVYQDLLSGMRELDVFPNGTIGGASRLLANHGEGQVAVAYDGAASAMQWVHDNSRMLMQTSACLADATPPPCPTLNGSFDGAKVTLSWNGVDDPESAILGWDLYRDGVELVEIDPATLTFDDYGFTPDTTHTYELRAMNGAYTESTGCGARNVFAGISISPATLPDGYVGSNYDVQLSASGGVAPYSFRMSGGTTPPNIGLSPDARIHGNATTAGTSSFSISATDSIGKSGSRDYTLRICNPMMIGPTILATGYAGSSYSQAVTVAGGSPPVTLQITSGTLPAGLAFAGNIISGTPAAAGTSPLAMTATDSIGCTASINWTLTIDAGTAARNLASWPATSSSIVLTWTDPQKGETGFRVERSLDGSSWQSRQIVGPDTPTYTDSSLSAATLYYYRVVAFGAAGDTAPSNVTAATTLAATPVSICATQIEASHTSATFAATDFNGTQWAAVWSEIDGAKAELYFQLFDRATGAAAGSPVRLTTTDASSRLPTLRWNGTNFGLTWGESMRGPHGEPAARAMFALLDASGNKIRGNVPVSGTVRSYVNDDLTMPLLWDGAGWGLFRLESPTFPGDVVFYHLDADGDVIAGPVTVAASADFEYNVSAAWSGSEYGVVWERQTEQTVWFQRMTSDGTLLGSPVKVFENTNKTGLGMTSIVWNGAGWAAAWSTVTTGDDQGIYMRLIGAAGNPLGAGPSRISDDWDLNGFTAQDQMPAADDLPVITLKPGGGYIVYAWSYVNRSGRAEVGRLEADASLGRVGSRQIASIDDGFNSQYHRVATDGTNHFLVWNDTAQGMADIGRVLLDGSGSAFGGPASVTSGHTLTGGTGALTLPIGQGFASLWLEPATASTTVTYAKIWDAAGSQAASKTPLFTRNPRARPAAVAFGDSFAIAYKENLTNDVVYARYDHMGNLVGSEVTVQPSAGGAPQTAIAFNGDSFGIAWIQGGRPNFRRVYPDGSFPGSRIILPASATSGSVLMTWTGAGWAIVWQNNTNLWYTLLDAEGATLTNPIQLTFSQFGIPGGQAQLAWNGSKLALVWTQNEPSWQHVWFTVFGLDGIKDFPEKLLSPGPWPENNPSLNWDTDHFRAAYVDSNSGGALVETGFLPDGTILPGMTFLSNRGGVSSVVWNGATLGINWQGLGANWFETSACLADTSPPPCPAPSGSFGAGGITLSWPAVTDPESGVYRYNVYRDDLMIAENFATTLSFVDGGYVPGQTHVYEVRAVNTALGESTGCSKVLVFAGTFPCGDVNADGSVTPLDIFYLINFLFADGPTSSRGDVNADGKTDAADVIYLINGLLASGPQPNCG